MNLKQLRHERGYSQQKLAQKLNVSRSTVAMWETGSSEPSLQMIQRIADVLSVSVAELFGEPADPSAHKGILIPVLGCVQAGLPNEAVEDVLDYEEITPELASTGEFFALRVRGDSMEPRFVNGQTVWVKAHGRGGRRHRSQAGRCRLRRRCRRPGEWGRGDHQTAEKKARGHPAHREQSCLRADVFFEPRDSGAPRPRHRQSGRAPREVLSHKSWKLNVIFYVDGSNYLTASSTSTVSFG